MNFWRAVVKALVPRSIADLENEYLAQSRDLIDLERRQRQIARGEKHFF